jgi:hypothetical protein
MSPARTTLRGARVSIAAVARSCRLDDHECEGDDPAERGRPARPWSLPLMGRGSAPARTFRWSGITPTPRTAAAAPVTASAAWVQKDER